MDHPAAWAEMPSHPACCRDWEGLLTNCYGLIPSMICLDRKSTRLNSSHDQISYAVFCLKKKKKKMYSISYKQKKINTSCQHSILLIGIPLTCEEVICSSTQTLYYLRNVDIRHDTRVLT